MSSKLRGIKDVLWGLALAGLVAAIFRLWYGLGVTTNLSDAFPWGLWKILNMIGGVALSTSGFTVGFLVYVLRLKRFEPFMKPAILIAFLGYGCSCLALLFDIGLPHRFWHPIFMWNINSFLFEVFWCVMLYFTVTAIELAPVLFERFRAKRIADALHHVAFVVVVIGISLSSLHHSSLGSLFLVTPQRLHPLWYTPWLPLLFITSAIGAGLMVVVLAKLAWARWYEPLSILGPNAGQQLPLIKVTNGATSAVFTRGPEGPEMPRIRALATIAAGVLGLYLVLKIADLFLHGGWAALMAGTWESWLYAGELLLSAVLPLVLMTLPWSRFSVAGVSTAAASAAAGLALNRLDVGILGYIRDAGSIYFPSLIEWAVGLGVVAAAGLTFLFMAENLPIFGPRPGAPGSRAGWFRLSYGSLSQLWHTVATDSLHRVTLIAVFVVPLAFVLMYPPYYFDSDPQATVRPAKGVDIERTSLFIDGDNGDVVTTFAHADHQHRLGDSASCVKCHHISMPGDQSTPCSRCHRLMNETYCIFDHEYHLSAVAEDKQLSGLYPTNFACAECHTPASPKTSASAKNCMECHKDDMFPAGRLAGDQQLLVANSYREAMHLTCVECHRDKAAEVERPHLADCRTCHPSLNPRPTEVTAVARFLSREQEMSP
ncbi:polysulfide reductase NrfD [bacterium]|nr:polysulfide reductase NrfD [bacterium]